MEEKTVHCHNGHRPAVRSDHGRSVASEGVVAEVSMSMWSKVHRIYLNKAVAMPVEWQAADSGTRSQRRKKEAAVAVLMSD
jgi:hypothetical protein